MEKFEPNVTLLYSKLNLGSGTEMMLRKVLQKSSKKKLSTGKEERDIITVGERTVPMDLVSQAPSVQEKRKRKGSKTIDENVGLRRKPSREDLNILDQRAESKDYISQLPEHIIHYILSLLRNAKDATRTSVLSKRWREIWTSFYILRFDQRKIQEEEKFLGGRYKAKAFKDFVDNSLKSHLEQKRSIQKLVLHISSYALELAPDINRWINIAIENNMKELDIHVAVDKNRSYSLPQTLFTAKTITGLRLCRCILVSLRDIKLSQLRNLYIRDVFIDQQTIENLISSCPLIEDLRFIRCRGFKDLQVSGLLKLDRFEVHHCHGPKRIEVKVPNLQTFWYCRQHYEPCKLDLVACVSLKRLTLEDVNMTDEIFQDMFATFPVLEKLDLNKCNKLKNITISSIRLKRLVLRGCTNLAEADIDAPNLSSFEYRGRKMPFSFSNISCLKEARLSFEPVGILSNQTDPGEENILWLTRLKEFLVKFNDSSGSKLVVRSKKDIIFHEELKDIFLLSCHDLKLETVRPSIDSEELLDKLLMTWRPETLSIVSSPCSELPKLLYQKMVDREENPRCCPYNSQNNKCWRHFLTDVKIENFEAADNRTWELFNWMKSSPTTLSQTTCFALCWDSHVEYLKAT